MMRTDSTRFSSRLIVNGLISTGLLCGALVMGCNAPADGPVSADELTLPAGTAPAAAVGTPPTMPEYVVAEAPVNETPTTEPSDPEAPQNPQTPETPEPSEPSAPPTTGPDTVGPVTAPAPVSCGLGDDVPRGTTSGKVLANLGFFNCNGEPVETDGLCAQTYTVFLNYCGWCPISAAHLAQAKDLAPGLAEQSVRFTMVVTNTSSGAPPTASYCKEIQAKVGPNVTVWYDPKGAYESISTYADTVLVLGPDKDDLTPNTILGKGIKKSFEGWLLPLLDSLTGSDHLNL